MTVDRTIPHHTLSPRGLLRTTLIWFSVHVSEQCTTAYITGDSLSVASRLLTTLFCITHQAHTDYWEAHECGFRCMWVNNVQLRTLNMTVCRLHHDCWLHCFVSRTEPTRIIKNHINGVLGTCEWTVCNCVLYRRQSIRCITIVDCPVPHHAPSPHKLLRNTLMRFSVHVSE